MSTSRRWPWELQVCVCMCLYLAMRDRKEWLGSQPARQDDAEGRDWLILTCHVSPPYFYSIGPRDRVHQMNLKKMARHGNYSVMSLLSIVLVTIFWWLPCLTVQQSWMLLYFSLVSSVTHSHTLTWGWPSCYYTNISPPLSPAHTHIQLGMNPVHNPKPQST